MLFLVVSYYLSATPEIKKNQFSQLTAKQVQPIVWQDIAMLNLPTGHPKLKKSHHVNLDAALPIKWQLLNDAVVEQKSFAQKNVSKAHFKVVEKQSVMPKWQTVKPLQYELDTLSDIRHFSMRQGLPTGTVYQTFQDAKGVLWLATNGEGACQYTANSFRCFKKTHGLSNNRVWRIAAGLKGELLFATDKGVNSFDGKVFRTLHINGQPFSDKINDIAVFNQAIFFITDKDMYRYENGEVSVVSVFSNSQLNRLMAFSQSLWLASNNGLFSLANNRITQFSIRDQACQGAVTSLTSEKQKVTFAVKGKGVCRVNLDNDTVAKLVGIKAPNITALLFDEENSALWVGDDSKGVFKIQSESAYRFNKSNGMSADHIRGLMKDDQGHIWVSSYSNGINRVKEHGFSLLNKRSGIKNERVSALSSINNQLWLGEYGGGIQIRAGGQWYELEESLNNPYIHSILQDKTGRIWVGTRQGIVVFGASGVTHIGKEQGLTANIIHKVIEAPNGCIYFASSNGVYRSCQNHLEKLNLENEQYVISVITDTKNRIWFVTNGGGTYYLTEQHVYRFTEKDGLSSNWAYSLEDDGTYLYIGTRNGIFVLNEQNKTWQGQLIGTENGLASSIVMALKAHKDYLWVGTEGGLNRVAIESLFNNAKTPIAIPFTYDNGYLAVDSTLNSAVITAENIYWGSANGLTYFNPDKINLKSRLASRILEVYSLGEDGKYYYLSDIEDQDAAAEFSPDTVQITLKYAHSDWASPERIMYQTRLKGSSETWSEPTILDQVTYNNLRPASYEFQIRAINGDQIGQPISYRFDLLPPWWQTWWAYTLFLCLLIMSIYLIIKWQFEAMRKQQRIKDRAEFSEALLARKKQLLAEVSHEIRTPLSVLKMQVEGLEYNIVDNNEKTYEVLHRRIADINTLIADIDQLANAELQELSLNLTTLLVKPWLEIWCNDAQTRIGQSEARHFSFRIDIPENLTLEADKKRLTQVLTNLLSNSIRYTKAPARIELAAYVEEGMCIISLSDSSPGVSNCELETIFQRMYQSEDNKGLYKGGTGLGLAICKDLITRHQGHIFAEHSELGGVTVTIKLKASE
ncbi:sensor histidine kinase [Pseudoalteromonas piratica]|nr:two-component regulator propeller domain-containing protein [Pseudoalteromonas piratica]